MCDYEYNSSGLKSRMIWDVWGLSLSVKIANKAGTMLQSKRNITAWFAASDPPNIFMFLTTEGKKVFQQGRKHDQTSSQVCGA